MSIHYTFVYEIDSSSMHLLWLYLSIDLYILPSKENMRILMDCLNIEYDLNLINYMYIKIMSCKNMKN